MKTVAVEKLLWYKSAVLFVSLSVGDLSLVFSSFATQLPPAAVAVFE
jgi:hypothetical protein